MNFNKLLAISVIVSFASLSFASSQNQLESKVNSLGKKIEELTKIIRESTISNKEMQSLVRNVTGEHMLTITEIIDLSMRELAEKGQENIDFLKNAGYALVNSPDGVKRLVNLNDLKKTSKFKLNKEFGEQKGKDEFISAFKKE